MGPDSAQKPELIRTGQRPRYTERGLAILCMIARGFTNFEIAGNLHISPHTVAQYIADMLRMAKARSRAELVARAYHDNILSPDSWPPQIRRHDTRVRNA